MATHLDRWTAPSWAIVVLFASFYLAIGLNAADAAIDDKDRKDPQSEEALSNPENQQGGAHSLELIFIEGLTETRREIKETPPLEKVLEDSIRLETLDAISDEGVKLVEEATRGAGGVNLVRLEPRREKKVKVMKRVWKPWVRTMLDSLSLSGYVYYFYQKYYSDSGPNDEYNLTGINIRLGSKSYVWRPWFAIMDGGIGVAADKLTSTISDTTTSHMTGDLNVTVFPTSRFPFRAGYARDWNDSASSYIGSNVATERYFVRQQYQNRTGGSVFGHYQHVTSSTDYRYSKASETNTSSTSVSDMYSLSAAKSFKQNSFNLSANVNKNTQDTQNTAIDTSTVVIIHKYTPSVAVSVDDNANIYNLHNSSTSTLAGQAISFDTNRYIFQGISRTFYRPSGNKLLADGGFRYFGTLDENSIAIENGPVTKNSSDTGNANLFASVTYTINQNLNANGTFSYDKTVIPANGLSSSNQGGGIDYHSDEMDLWSTRYSWRANLSAQNQINDQQSSLMAQPGIGHGITKNIGLSPSSSIDFSLNQNFSIVHYIRAAHGSYIVPYPQTQENIGHTASLAWNYKGFRGIGGVRLSVSDMRTRGVADKISEQVTQLAFLQANIDINITRYSRIYVDWVIQYTRGTFTTEAYDELVNTRGFLSYRNLRVLGVRNLSFDSELRIADQSFLPNFGDQNQQESASWENRLLYRIGKLEISGLYRIAEINTTRQDILMLRITRNFGN